MIVTLGDIMNCEVEIPAEVRHYKIKSIDGIVYRGYGESGAGADLDRLMNEKVSALWWHFWDEWPRSLDWTVEWE